VIVPSRIAGESGAIGTARIERAQRASIPGKCATVDVGTARIERAQRTNIPGCAKREPAIDEPSGGSCAFDFL
jgi:hypothetical protein